MQRMRIILVVALSAWCVFLKLAGVNAQELTERQLLYETLSEKDRSAVKDAIDTYDGRFLINLA